jgi:uncharacterized protein YbaA (DUF1428 family)
MRYVDGYVIPVRKNNVKAYAAMARWGKRMWLKHGALDYMECIGDDLTPPFGAPFAKCARAKPGETVVFSFVVFKSRAHRDRVNAKAMKSMSSISMPKKMPFDVKRMFYGGFKVLVGR